MIQLNVRELLECGEHESLPTSYIDVKYSKFVSLGDPSVSDLPLMETPFKNPKYAPVSNHFNDLLALLVVFKILIISQRSKHIMHTIF